MPDRQRRAAVTVTGTQGLAQSVSLPAESHQGRLLSAAVCSSRASGTAGRSSWACRMVGPSPALGGPDRACDSAGQWSDHPSSGPKPYWQVAPQSAAGPAPADRPRWRWQEAWLTRTPDRAGREHGVITLQCRSCTCGEWRFGANRARRPCVCQLVPAVGVITLAVGMSEAADLLLFLHLAPLISALVTRFSSI
jgi:hypothetical protein